MNKMMSMILMVLGVFFMGVIAIVYSFSTIEIPKIMYITLWCVCIGMVRLAVGFGTGLER